jgi:putative addiction module CopG family antidote
LPETLKEFVLKRVEEGAFSNPSDYVRALIRADRARREELDRLLLEGLASKAEPVTADYRAELRREVEAIVAQATPKRA